jgi:hypothetical protein
MQKLQPFYERRNMRGEKDTREGDIWWESEHDNTKKEMNKRTSHNVYDIAMSL